MIRIMEEWSKENDLPINFDKSGIMVLRADRRTRRIQEDHIGKLPVVSNYKYLGILFDDSLKFDYEVAKKKR